MLFLVVILALSGLSPMATASPVDANNSRDGEIGEYAQSLPKKIYLKDVVKYTNGTIPPAKISHTIESDGVKYTGTLTRTDYASTGDGRYLALYSGYVYR